MLQDEFAELREALADARKEASSAQATAAAELQSVRRQHKNAVQVWCPLSPLGHAQGCLRDAFLLAAH